MTRRAWGRRNRFGGGDDKPGPSHPEGSDWIAKTFDAFIFVMLFGIILVLFSPLGGIVWALIAPKGTP